MIRRAFAAIVIVWALGFVWFAMSLPGPAGEQVTDAIVVPTGGQGRIDRGLELLERGRAKQLLVTGVDTEVKPGEFAAEYHVPARLMGCCVTLGFAALDTRGNAAETAAWVAQRHVTSLRLVTTDWHMRRAALELSAEIPGKVALLQDAVPSKPSLRILLLEYHKLVTRYLARMLPW